MITTREEHIGDFYRAPLDLLVNATPMNRVLIVGSCLSESWAIYIPKLPRIGCACDWVGTNNLNELPAAPPRPVTEYNFQVVQISLGNILPEQAFSRLAYADIDGHKALFEQARAHLRHLLEMALKWNREQGMLTFVSNLLVPQTNGLGRLLPRYDIRNIVHVVERLNEALGAELAHYSNVHLLDIDQIAATLGRKNMQDDHVWPTTHGGLFWDADHNFDKERIAPPPPASHVYGTNPLPYIRMCWSEMIAMYRSVRQLDSVKLVIMDLDDTLWRGVAAEQTLPDPHRQTSGWPQGLSEALCLLKKRGVLLAIVSKNDEGRIEALWDGIMLGRLSLSDFAVRKINWRPKADNIKEILAQVNLLPRNVVFVDDNPVERAAVGEAFPEMRILGADIYFLRRVLLWSPETQSAAITDESGRRTEMIQAQLDRDDLRQSLSREEFLASLGLKVRMGVVGGIADAEFARGFELLNKTNQFNTTGRRHEQAECAQAFASGTVFHTFHVEDRFVRYGLVGVAVVRMGRIEQFVMSCRVIGLDVEKAVIAEILRKLAGDGVSEIGAVLVPTEANFPCRDLYERCGFRLEGDLWTIAAGAEPTAPPHVTISGTD